MANASALIADIQVLVGDTASTFLTDTIALSWLDQAQNQLATKLFPLTRTKGFVVSADQQSFAIPAECVMLEVVYNAKNVRQVLRKVSPGEFEIQKTRVPDATGTPLVWTEREGRVYIWPRYPSASLTSTINATTTASATTLTLASTGNLRTSGRVIVGSEEVEYVGKTSTTLTNCLRGAGGTTAATAASADTVTQVDFELFFKRQPVALSSTTAPEIPAAYHDTLKLWVQYLYYLAEGSRDKASAIKAEWDQALKDHEYNIARQDLGPLTVKDVDSQRLTGLWGPTP